MRAGCVGEERWLRRRGRQQDNRRCNPRGKHTLVAGADRYWRACARLAECVGSGSLWSPTAVAVYTGSHWRLPRPAETSPRTRRLSVHASWKIGCTFGAPAGPTELTQTFGLAIGSSQHESDGRSRRVVAEERHLARLEHPRVHLVALEWLVASDCRGIPRTDSATPALAGQMSASGPQRPRRRRCRRTCVAPSSLPAKT